MLNDTTLVDRLRLTIPEGMQQQQGWLLWRDENGSKVPYRLDGQRRAGTHNTPEDVAGLGTFAQAAAAAHALTGQPFTGLGYAPRPELGVTGLDLDNKSGNPQVRAFHRLVLEAVPGAYVEKSPSRKGGHCYLRGNGLGHRKHHVAGVEIFEAGFLTVTGDTITPGAELVEITPRLRELLSKRHLDLVEAAILLAPVWVQPRRHAITLPLVGSMLSAGWAEAEVSTLISMVCKEVIDLELPDRLAVVCTTAQRLRAGQTASGLPTLAEAIGEELTAKLKKSLSLGTYVPPAVTAGGTVLVTLPGGDSDEEDDEDIVRPKPMRAEAYHGLAGRFVELIGPRIEACKEALLPQFLVAAGCAAGRAPHLYVGADRHGLNEFLVVAGATSKARKGMSWSFVERAILDAVPVFQPRISASLTTGEGLIHLIRDPKTRMEEDKDGHIEEKVIDPGVADKRLLAMLQEFSIVLAQSSREGNTLSAMLRIGWDGKPLSNALRDSGRGAEQCQEPHVSVAAHITNQELRATLTTMAQANGLANRFLFLHVGRVRLLPDGGGFPPPAEWLPFIEALRSALVYQPQVQRFTWTPAALELWSGMYRELAQERLGLLGLLLARSEAHVLRLALIYAMLDASREITPAHLLAARAVVDYCIESTSYIFKYGTGNRDADRILEALTARPGGMTRWEISGQLFQRHRKASQLNELLENLVALGHIRAEDETTKGRPAVRYFSSEAAKEAKKAK